MPEPLPSRNAGLQSGPWALLRVGIGTLVSAAVVFGLSFQVVSAVVLIAAGAAALGAGAAVFASRRARPSSPTEALVRTRSGEAP